jgi:hypothetical protein
MDQSIPLPDVPPPALSSPPAVVGDVAVLSVKKNAWSYSRNASRAPESLCEKTSNPEIDGKAVVDSDRPATPMLHPAAMHGEPESLKKFNP